IVMLVNATRRDTRVRIGCSPRGSKMLLRAAQSRALLNGRQFVLPDDVQALAVEVIAHRIALRTSGNSSVDAAHVVLDIVKSTEVPV
ncbi:magnesium chelatase, partial [bacterium]|nr:magnesium chelatase [bacterium]